MRFPEMMMFACVALSASVHLLLANGAGGGTSLSVANPPTREGELNSHLFKPHTPASSRRQAMPSHGAAGLLKRTLGLRRATRDNILALQGASDSTFSQARMLDAVEGVVRQSLSHCLLVLGSPVSDDLGYLEGFLKKVTNQSLVPTLVIGPRPATTEARSGFVDFGSSCATHVKVVYSGAGWDIRVPLVRAPTTYLLLVVPPNATNGEDLTRLLLDPGLPRDFDVFLLLPASSLTGEVGLYRRCLHCEGGKEGVRLVDTWVEGSFTQQLSLTDDQLTDLHGHVFQTVSMDFAPFIDYTQEAPGGVARPKDSMDIRILQIAAKAFNFSFVLREPGDEQWGYLLENGSWTGTVGTVQRGQADFSMMLSITWERTYAVSFTRAYYVEPMTFVVRKPGPLPQWQAPLKPFHWLVWLMVVVSVMLSGPVLWLILRSVAASPTHPSEEEIKGKRAKERNLSFGLMCLYMLAPIFAEPVPLFPRSWSSRVFCGMWWFFCILTTTLYRGSLIARLTVPERRPSLDTLEQLASSSLDWGMLDTYGSGYQLFRASQVPVYQALFQRMQYYDMGDSMEHVLRGDYAFISWKTYFRNLIARDYTEKNGATQVHIASEEFFPGGFGWAFPKDSPYLIKFDEVFQRLIESGLIDLWMADLIQLSASENREKVAFVEEVVEEEEEGSRAFTVFHLQGIFFIMMGGFLLALVALLAEVLLMFLITPSSSE